MEVVRNIIGCLIFVFGLIVLLAGLLSPFINSDSEQNGCATGCGTIFISVFIFIIAALIIPTDTIDNNGVGNRDLGKIYEDVDQDENDEFIEDKDKDKKTVDQDENDEFIEDKDKKTVVLDGNDEFIEDKDKDKKTVVLDGNDEFIKKLNKVEKMMSSLEKDRKYVLDIKDDYSERAKKLYPEVSKGVVKSGYKSHKEFLIDCDKYYIDLCSKLDRLAKLLYYRSKLEDKLEEIRIQSQKLDDIKWDIGRKIELSQIFSDQELEEIEQLIEKTEDSIEKRVSSPEKQDIASIEEKVFKESLAK